jgi:hypothetical protein
MTAKFSSLTVSGFRSCGADPQTLKCDTALTIVGGTNSQGKTSLAEAFEFLLTGRIVRRELTASAQDEFADALRNAHLDADTPVYVAAEIVDTAGATHALRRELTGDYGRREDCKSVLSIDGKPADREALAALGFVYSQPPLEASVLAQHTLSYLFSARPQERANYFKTLLEVADLDTFRNAVAASEVTIAEPPNVLLQNWDKCRGTELFATAFAKIDTPTTPDLTNAFSAMAADLLQASAVTPPAEATARFAALQTLLGEKLNKAFPLAAFGRKSFARPQEADASIWAALALYVQERAKIEAETLRLLRLFQEALRIPEVASTSAPIDCPLCAAPTFLSPARVKFIKTQVAATTTFTEAENKARAALADLEIIISAAASGSKAAVPTVASWTRAQRIAQGFRIGRMRSLLGATGDDLIRQWLKAYRPLVRRARELTSLAQKLDGEVNTTIANLATFTDRTVLQKIATNLAAVVREFETALASYAEPAQKLGAAVSADLAENSATVGWQEFLDLSDDLRLLRTQLIERHALAAVRKELGAALRQIDQAKDKVLDDKFGDLSKAVQAWWELLRPEEMTFFSAVKPRPNAKRTVDLKVALAVDGSRANPKLRDAIAVFSQSQIHCLGLALFLARAEHEGAAFVILDDPILTSDEDHRLHFCADVVDALLKKSIQVIVLTQDEPTRRNLTSRYAHISPSQYQLVLDDPKEGTVFDNKADNLAAMLSHADTLSRSNHPTTRKDAGERLRDTAERYCKEMLVAATRAAGKSAAITDYDRKTLESLIPPVESLLSKDASHPGKLRTIPMTLNPANHDDNIPSRAALRQVLGDLKFLKKEYLG